jgi:hypothetical protein
MTFSDGQFGMLERVDLMLILHHLIDAIAGAIFILCN